MRLSVIVPNFNGEHLLPPLLGLLEKSLAGAGYDWEIIVADDASSDSSRKLVSDSFPFVRLVEGERNLGYGGNCNRGARAASGEYLAFVNTDVSFDGDVFKPLMDRLAGTRGVFALMPLVYAEPLGRVENLQEIWISRGLPWLRPVSDIFVDRWEDAAKALGDTLKPVPLCGAFFVCRGEQFRELGGFAPAFGKAYWEDVDLGYRARGLGLATVVCGDTVVRHAHSQTLNRVLGERKKRRRLLRNQALFLKRNLELLRPVPWYRLYLLARIPQRIATGDWGTIPLYFSLIFGAAR
jgi:GT2 family glycosyltransferase